MRLESPDQRTPSLGTYILGFATRMHPYVIELGGIMTAITEGQTKWTGREHHYLRPELDRIKLIKDSWAIQSTRRTPAIILFPKYTAYTLPSELQGLAPLKS